MGGSPNATCGARRDSSWSPPDCSRARSRPDQVADHLSAAYLVAVNARTVSEVGSIAERCGGGDTAPTLTIDTVIGFRSPQARASFSSELQSAIAALVARYHHDDGRPHRLTVSSYPDRGASVTIRPGRPDRVEHRAEFTVEMSATPEQVWAAIATADGISAWMVPTRLEPRIGGEVSFDHGGLRSTGVVTDYTPGRRFAYEEPWPMTEADARVGGRHRRTRGHRRGAGGDLPDRHRVPDRSSLGRQLRPARRLSSYGSGADWENEYFAEMVAGWGSTPFGPDGQTPWLDNLTAT